MDDHVEYLTVKLLHGNNGREKEDEGEKLNIVNTLLVDH